MISRNAALKGKIKESLFQERSIASRQIGKGHIPPQELEERLRKRYRSLAGGEDFHLVEAFYGVEILRQSIPKMVRMKAKVRPRTD